MIDELHRKVSFFISFSFIYIYLYFIIRKGCPLREVIGLSGNGIRIVKTDEDGKEWSSYTI